MFSLKVTEVEIQRTLNVLANNVYPKRILLVTIAKEVFYPTALFSCTISDIEKRKIRLCITEIRKRGVLVIAKNGYSLAGDDPEQVIHFINGLYSRANKLTQEADIMFHGLKQKYGDSVSEKIQAMPGQPAIDFDVSQCKTITREEVFGEKVHGVTLQDILDDDDELS